MDNTKRIIQSAAVRFHLVQTAGELQGSMAKICRLSVEDKWDEFMKILDDAEKQIKHLRWLARVVKQEEL